MSLPQELADQIAQLFHRIAELERRGQNGKRTGTVAEVDYAKGLYRVQIKPKGSDGKPYLTGWLRLKEIAMGDIKAHFPLSLGEQVSVVSENGDLTDAEIEPCSTPSTANQRPHDKGGEAVLQVGTTRLLMKDGLFAIQAARVEINQAGGSSPAGAPLA